MVLVEIHASPTVGHSSFGKIYEHVKHCFFSEGMKQDIYTFVAECDAYQHHKGETVKDPCTFQLLLIPPTIWKDISMDFKVGLPKSRNQSVIMVVVDHISKYAHLCALQHPFTASAVARVFMDNIFKIHGMPHLTDIQLSPTIFGKNCSSSKEPNYTLTPHIILRLIEKSKFSTSVWKHICCVMCLEENISGISDYP
jgi:hypothetical protein